MKYFLTLALVQAVALAMPLPGHCCDSAPDLMDLADACRAQHFTGPLEFRKDRLDGLGIGVTVLDHFGEERHLLLAERGGLVSLRVTATTNGSFESQFEEIYAKTPEIDPHDICDRVRIESFFPEDIDSDELDRVVAEFKGIRVKPTIGGPTVVHGNIYEIWVLFAGNHAEFSFFGVPADPQPSNPLQEWVDNLLARTGQTCTSVPGETKLTK